MSEGLHVEKPFLERLKALGWNTIEHGPGIPTDPANSRPRFHHRDHTEAFWNEIDKVLSDFRERKEWLRRNGAGLDV